MRRVAWVVALVACGKPEPKPTVEKPTAAIADAAVDAAPPSDAAAEPGEVAITDNDRVCPKIDARALAKALGVSTLTLKRGGELMKGGNGPNSLTCTWREKPDATDVASRGLNFGFSIEATTELEEKDFMDRFVWEPYEGLGQTAKIAVAYEGLHLQTVVKGVLLHTDIDFPTDNPSRLDKKLVAATKLVMQQLPADVANELK